MTEVFIPTLATDANNFLASSRGVFVINPVERFELYCTQFSIPGLTAISADMDTPFSKMHFRPDKIEYDELPLTFLVREDLSNWKVIHDWIVGLGFPHSFKESKDRELTYTDATLHIFSNNNLPKLRVKFTNLFPVTLGSVNFSTTDSDVTQQSAAVTFIYDTFEIEVPASA